MKISVTTTLDGMIVTDTATKQVLPGIDVVEVRYDAITGRTMTYLGTYGDSTIEVHSTAPDQPTPTPTPTPPAK